MLVQLRNVQMLATRCRKVQLEGVVSAFIQGEQHTQEAYRPIATRNIIYAIAPLRADACRFTRCQGVLARGRAAQLSAATAHARADAHTWSRALRLPLRCPRPGNCHYGQKHAGDVPAYESHQ